jgi:hypothetical protein
MRPIYFVFPAIVLVLCSCGNTQYLAVSSPQAVHDDRKGLIVENDTVRLIYSFNTYRSQLTVSVYNKSPLPIEVNWQKSGFIMNETPAYYHSPGFAMEGNANIDTTGSLFRTAGYSAKLSGNILLNENLIFLPPRSGLSKTFDVLPHQKLKNLPLKEARKEKIGSGMYSFTYKSMAFTAEASPLIFRSFLTYSIGGREVFMDHGFHISEVWQSKSHPVHLPTRLKGRKDWFFL